MSETSDKALDLADQWAKAISQKLTDAAPGAYDVAVEAVKVKIGSEILSWILLVVCFICIVRLAIFLWGKASEAWSDSDRYQRNEEVPFQIAAAISSVVGAFMLIGVAVNFPSREIIGLFAPKAYVALMLFDSVKSRK